jgi:hypothetical protein
MNEMCLVKNSRLSMLRFFLSSQEMNRGFQIAGWKHMAGRQRH